MGSRPSYRRTRLSDLAPDWRGPASCVCVCCTEPLLLLLPLPVPVPVLGPSLLILSQQSASLSLCPQPSQPFLALSLISDPPRESNIHVGWTPQVGPRILEPFAPKFSINHGTWNLGGRGQGDWTLAGVEQDPGDSGVTARA
ncbi:hypothetical protein BO71DRAFT_115428 [Aspergillus ellipticus CBS 707.79]|uniref:Uncharacterized protein n=1 Tax=Aspergillus ellipticus CBS 707.79 TaxID=1448320 RepID=A0A319DJI0_9EURO|nr:hypothetical protein BO71DRAFT_115428 [Aspergillus ellipticus CBS 707.79]